MSQKRFYDDDEAEQILKIAAKRMGMHGSVSREQLLATAAELGISAQDLEDAEQEYQKGANEQAQRREFDIHMRRDFMSHLVSYLIVNVGLLFLDFRSDGHLNWAFWPLGGWGIAILFHAWSTFARGSDDYEQEFEKWRENRVRQELGYTKAEEILDDISSSLDIHREKIAAIKELRQRTGMQLKDAKDAVDEYVRQHG